MYYIKESYERRQRYCGFHSYHSHDYNSLNRPINYDGSIDCTNKYLVGVEMEVEFEYEDDRDEFADTDSNYYYCESDGSLDDEGCEIITVPLRPSDARSVDFWEELCDEVSSRASADSGNCGLHVHFGKAILGHSILSNDEYEDNLGKLLYFYHHVLKDTDFNKSVYGRSVCYSERDGKTPQGGAIDVLGRDVLRDKNVQDMVKKASINKGYTTRYFDINITNGNTIEFRKGAGTVSAEIISMIVEYSELICWFVKSVDWEDLILENFAEFLKENARNERLIQKVKSYLLCA